MSRFISQLHSLIRSARTTKRGASMQPDMVKTGQHKSYERMMQIPLPTPAALDFSLTRAIKERRSFNGDARSTEPFSSNEIGTLLGVSLGVHTDGHRRHYPSGGALFPIETYLIGNVLSGQTPGVYHYNPTAHALEHLWDVSESFSTLDITTTTGVPQGSLLVMFTGFWERSSAKYGDLAYLHATIEAGHMAQNILLVATALSLSARPVAGFKDDEVATLLDIDKNTEQPLYAIVLAHTSDTPRTSPSPSER